MIAKSKHSRVLCRSVNDEGKKSFMTLTTGQRNERRDEEERATPPKVIAPIILLFAARPQVIAPIINFFTRHLKVIICD
jgi:hypothetical protein